MAEKKKIKYLTRTDIVFGHEVTMYSLDGATWSSRREELFGILDRHEKERMTFGGELKGTVSSGKAKGVEPEEAAPAYRPEDYDEEFEAVPGSRVIGSAEPQPVKAPPKMKKGVPVVATPKEPPPAVERAKPLAARKPGRPAAPQPAPVATDAKAKAKVKAAVAPPPAAKKAKAPVKPPAPAKPAAKVTLAAKKEKATPKPKTRASSKPKASAKGTKAKQRKKAA